jgi:hypothetical protein
VKRLVHGIEEGSQAGPDGALCRCASLAHGRSGWRLLVGEGLLLLLLGGGGVRSCSSGEGGVAAIGQAGAAKVSISRSFFPSSPDLFSRIYHSCWFITHDSCFLSKLG